MCTPPQFIGGLVAHEFHVTVRIRLGGESVARREVTQQLVKLTRPAGFTNSSALTCLHHRSTIVASCRTRSQVLRFGPNELSRVNTCKGHADDY